MYTTIAGRGTPGARFTATTVAHAWDLEPHQVAAWCKRGIIQASLTQAGWRIRRKALRRALEAPEVQRALIKAAQLKAHQANEAQWNLRLYGTETKPTAPRETESGDGEATDAQDDDAA